MEQIAQYWPLASVVVNGFVLWVAWSLRQLAKKEVSDALAAAVVTLNKAIADQAVAADKSLQEHAEAAAKSLQEHAAADRKMALEIDAQDTRLTKMEERIDALPQRQDIVRLEQAVTALSGTMHAQGATLLALERGQAGTQNGVDRLYAFMLEHR